MMGDGAKGPYGSALLGALREWGPYKSRGSASVFPCSLPLLLYDMVSGSDAGPGL